MTKLESRAKAMFERFAIRTTGKSADWRRLNLDRKLAWMNETAILLNSLIEDTKKEYMKPYKSKPAETSFENGLIQGITSERMRIMDFLENFNVQLKKDMDNFRDENI